MFVYANVFFHSLHFSFIQIAWSAMCNTLSSFTARNSIHFINIQFLTGKRTRTVNTLPEKKERKNFEKVIQFSDFLSFEQNATVFIHTTYSCKWANYCQWNTNIYCFSCNELMKNVSCVCKNCYSCTSCMCTVYVWQTRVDRLHSM